MSDPEALKSAYRDAHPPSTAARWNPRALQAFAMTLASVALPPLAITTLMATNPPLYGATRTLLFAAIAAATLALAVLGVQRGWRVLGELPSLPVPEKGRGFALASMPLGALGAFFGLMGFFVAWLSTIQFGRGRQLRRRGRVLLAPVTRGSQWTTGAMTLSIDASSRDALAAQWRENGRTEHASVAAFARVSLDLMALGAPAALLAAASADAADEVRHTEFCFSLARAIDGREESPGAFPDAAKVGARSSSRRVALASLAVDSLIDGALHEGVSARVVAKLAKRCETPAIREVLKEIAADEGRHAAHGWDVVEWCIDEGGSVVAHALVGALAALPAALHTPLPEGAVDGSWERWGIHGRALEAEEYDRALVDLKTRVRRRCA